MTIPPIELLQHVASNLGDLLPKAIFLGGSIVGLLVIEKGGRLPRTTKDVDLAIKISTFTDGLQIDSKLKALGFTVRMDEPISRYFHGEVMIDVILVSEENLGTVNNWYPLAIETATKYELPNGLLINLIAPACFIGTKLVAFNSEDREYYGDILQSRDFGDIVTVIDGRPDIVQELEGADEGLRAYIGKRIQEILTKDYLEVAIDEHVDPGRSLAVIDKLQKISVLS